MKGLTIVLIAAFLGFAFFSATLKHELLGNQISLRLVQQGMTAPNFQAVDLNHNQVDLREVAKGKKAVLVTFWATWCDPCAIELTNFQKIYHERKGAGVEFLAVVEDPQQAPEYLAGKDLTLPIVLDPGQSIAKSYGVRTLPSTVVMGPTLSVIASMEGSGATMVDRALAFITRGQRGR